MDKNTKKVLTIKLKEGRLKRCNIECVLHWKIHILLDKKRKKIHILALFLYSFFLSVSEYLFLESFIPSFFFRVFEGGTTQFPTQKIVVVEIRKFSWSTK